MTLKLSVTVSVWIALLITSECGMIKTQKPNTNQREKLWDVKNDTR